MENQSTTPDIQHTRTETKRVKKTESMTLFRFVQKIIQGELN